MAKTPKLHVVKELFFAILFLSALASLPSICYAQEEIIATDQVKDAVFWDMGKEKHDASLEFIRVSPLTPEGSADSLRISFTRSSKSTDRKTKPAKKIIYSQKWSLTLDTLKIRTRKSNCKVYVDGVYDRDSDAIMGIDYLAVGPVSLKCYNYRDLNNTPTGRPDELIYKGHTYFPVSEYFFTLLSELDAWPVVRTVKNEEPLLSNIYLNGPDSTYVTSIDANRKVVAKVTKDHMEISLVEKNRPIKHYLFSKENKSHTVTKYDKEKGQYSRTFTHKEDNSPFIEVGENEIAFIEGTEKTQFKIDGSQISSAINLAKIRKILDNDNKISHGSSELFEGL